MDVVKQVTNQFAKMVPPPNHSQLPNRGYRPNVQYSDRGLSFDLSSKYFVIEFRQTKSLKIMTVP